MTQISDYLITLSATVAAQTLPLSLQSIHIISHGNAGSLLLGSSTVTASNLGSHSRQLATMGNALSQNGDILLYGCNVAADPSGLQFINRLAGLTNADVAASNDITGSAVLGGDWVLEAATGTIESSLAWGAAKLNSYADILSGPDEDFYYGGDGIDTISYRSAIISITINLVPGTASGIEIGNDQLYSIENIIGGSADDTLIGDAGDNVLDGSAGNDILIGNEGDDHLMGDDGIDTVSYSSAIRNIIVNLARGNASGIEIGNDKLNSIEVTH